MYMVQSDLYFMTFFQHQNIKYTYYGSWKVKRTALATICTSLFAIYDKFQIIIKFVIHNKCFVSIIMATRDKIKYRVDTLN